MLLLSTDPPRGFAVSQRTARKVEDPGRRLVYCSVGAAPSSRGLGRGPLKAETGIRIPLGPPLEILPYFMRFSKYRSKTSLLSTGASDQRDGHGPPVGSGPRSPLIS